MPKQPNKRKDVAKVFNHSKEQNYTIAKSNHLVQKTQYVMPRMETKVLANLISHISPKQKNLTVHFDAKDFARLVGLPTRGGSFERIKDAIQGIANRSFWIKMQNGRYMLWQWFLNAVGDPSGNGKFKITFHPNLKKLLLHQRTFATFYRFSEIMEMGNGYSPRLYEIFRGNQSLQHNSAGLNYPLMELKENLDLVYRHKNSHRPIVKNGKIKTRYPRFGDFWRRVLKPSVRDINLYTNYNIRMRRCYKGRKVIGVNVFMAKKNKQQQFRTDVRIFDKSHHTKLTHDDIKNRTSKFRHFQYQHKLLSEEPLLNTRHELPQKSSHALPHFTKREVRAFDNFMVAIHPSKRRRDLELNHYDVLHKTRKYHVFHHMLKEGSLDSTDIHKVTKTAREHTHQQESLWDGMLRKESHHKI